MTLKEIHELTGILLTKQEPETIMECRNITGDRDNVRGLVINHMTGKIHLESDTSFYEEDKKNYEVHMPD